MYFINEQIQMQSKFKKIDKDSVLNIWLDNQLDLSSN